MHRHCKGIVFLDTRSSCACGYPRIKSGAPPNGEIAFRGRRLLNDDPLVLDCTKFRARGRQRHKLNSRGREDPKTGLSTPRNFIGTASARSAFSHQEKSKKEIAMRAVR
jgi:hypothetical protein